ncbi:MFS transporter [Streptomyces vinaceus]|uniref:MFS transporter n=1 Tax=Streptomyces vinaceus TaxID=1960 RepID=UPI0038001F98
MSDTTPARTPGGLRRVIAPLALAQFICSFAGSNMNVMINDISEDLDTTVQGVQVAITVFLLVMAALMIPGGKLTDRYGPQALPAHRPRRVRSRRAAERRGPGPGRSHPRQLDPRRRRGWRAAFVFQALVIVVIVFLSRRIEDPLPPDPTRPFDTVGTLLSAAGLILVVTGILAADDNLWLMLALLVLGALFLTGFFAWVRARERAGKEALLSTSLFRSRISNLGLMTQNAQWLLLMGVSFTVASYLQVVRGYDAIQTGVIFTAATLGILVSSLAAERLAERRAQRTLIITGFVTTTAGIVVLVLVVGGSPSPWVFAPGLLLIGLGLGVMLTPSVNIVQSSFTEDQQGEISGLSRSVSNLGSSLGTAVAGTILVAGLTGHAYAAAMITLAAVGLIGLTAAALLPRHPPQTPASDPGGV